MNPGEFHERDGWYFSRMENGDVLIRYPGGEKTVSADGWPSVVAHVADSKSGDASERFARARQLHAAPPEAIPGTCSLCGEAMPPGEEMFVYHGYSGPCPPRP